MAKEHIWFSEGANAFRRLMNASGHADLLPDGDWYPCPLCLRKIFRVQALDTGELTVEHVPPRAVGGRELLLTCWSCNNLAGRTFDAHASRLEQLSLSLSGRSEAPIPGKLTLGETTVNAIVQNLPETGITYTISGHHNSPESTEAFDLVFGSLRMGKPHRMQFSVKAKISHRHASWSWVRSAYLVAFAALGWRYITSSDLELVRVQLLARSSMSSRRPYHHDAQLAFDSRVVLIVEEPEECRSVMVNMGPHTVFLPYLLPGGPSPDELSQALTDYSAARSAMGAKWDLNGKQVPWPKRPKYALDPTGW